MHHDYFECKKCGTLSSPRSAGVGIVDLYKDSVHNSQMESRFAAATYLALVGKHLKHRPDSVLDIGCSDGAFLTAMADLGVKTVEGVEPSHDAARLAIDARLHIHVKGFEEFQTSRRYELITLFQTIEHLADPYGTLARIRDLCAPNGYLMIVCHDRLSVVNRVLGQRSPIFDIEHLQIFTQSGLSSLLQRVGLQVRVLDRFTNKYPLSYAIRLAGIDLGAKSLATRISIPIPAGNVVIFAQPASR